MKMLIKQNKRERVDERKTEMRGVREEEAEKKRGRKKEL
jgi:hypothetical protein